MNPSSLVYSSTNIHHGLMNRIGDNNCFVNCVLQCLWHLGPFRFGMKHLIAERNKSEDHLVHDKDTSGDIDPLTMFSREQERKSMTSFLLDSLMNLFIQYEFTDLSTIPANELRRSLSSISDKFKIGDIADANEALESILQQLHVESKPVCPTGHHKCISHTVFSGLIIEQSTCHRCLATSEPQVKSDFIHSIYAHELISISRQTKTPLYFGELLKQCLQTHQRKCPSIDMTPSNDPNPDICNQRPIVNCFCLESPLVLGISVVWSNEREAVKSLRDFIELISEEIVLSDLFSIPDYSSANGEGTAKTLPYLDSNKSESKSQSLSIDSSSYIFRGLVCYYGKHYISIIQELSVSSSSSAKNSTTSPRFLLFDDNLVRVIGDWRAVRDEILKSHYQPVLLLYELRANANGLAKARSHPMKTSYFQGPVSSLMGRLSMAAVSADPTPVKLPTRINANSTPTVTASSTSVQTSPTTSTVKNISKTSSVSLHSESALSTASPSSSTQIAVQQPNIPTPTQIQQHQPHKSIPVSNICWGYRYKQTRVLFPLVASSNTSNTVNISSFGGTRLLNATERAPIGLAFDANEFGHIIVTGFPRDKSGKKLSAEACGQIQLLDRVLRVNSFDTRHSTVNETSRVFKQLSHENVELLVESISKKELWYQCESCRETSASPIDSLRYQLDHVDKAVDRADNTGDNALPNSITIGWNVIDDDDEDDDKTVEDRRDSTDSVEHTVNQWKESKDNEDDDSSNKFSNTFVTNSPKPFKTSNSNNSQLESELTRSNNNANTDDFDSNRGVTKRTLERGQHILVTCPHCQQVNQLS